MSRRLATQKDYEIYLTDLSEVNFIDGSAALALDEFIESALNENRKVLMVGFSHAVFGLLGRVGVLDRVRETMRFSSRKAALRAALSMVEEKP